jgi:hypothetical protein
LGEATETLRALRFVNKIRYASRPRPHMMSHIHAAHSWRACSPMNGCACFLRPAAISHMENQEGSTVNLSSTTGLGAEVELLLFPERGQCLVLYMYNHLALLCKHPSASLCKDQTGLWHSSQHDMIMHTAPCKAYHKHSTWRLQHSSPDPCIDTNKLRQCKLLPGSRTQAGTHVLHRYPLCSSCQYVK